MTVLGADGTETPAPDPEQPRRRWNTPELRRRVLIGAVLAWAVAITAVVLIRDGDDPVQPAAVAPKPSASAGPLSPADVYKTVLPSVVLIQTTGHTAAKAAESGTGTGVIANADGTILTAFHVVDGAETIKVSYADGTSSAAKIAGSNPKQDIATLTPAKLPETLVPAVLGGGTAVGDDVVAIGNPLGLTATTTTGIVSALDRTVTEGGAGKIAGLIQFDAAVNPGSSGGPLINDQAQVVGIVVALANPTSAGTFIGIGFAVPIGAALGTGGEGDGRNPPL